MYSVIKDGSVPVYAPIGWMTASTKFTGVDVVGSTNRSAIGSFVTWMIFLIMVATKSVPSSGGASGKKKAD